MPPRAGMRDISRDDFGKRMADMARSLRETIATQVGGLDPSPAARAARVDRAQGDFRFFASTYFPHAIYGEPSRFHLWWYDTLPPSIDAKSGARIAVAAPRGNAKTAYSRVLLLWCLLTGRKHNALIFGATAETAAELLEGVKAELDSNLRISQDYPDHFGPGPVWQVGAIITRGGAKVRAVGAGKKVRGANHCGKRPDIIILDDLENDENVRSPEQRDKMEKWVDGTVLPLGPPDQNMDIIYVGTLLHYDSVLARKLHHPLWKSRVFRAIIRGPDRTDLWEQWEEIIRNKRDDDSHLTEADAFYRDHEREMVAGSEVLWPSVQPLLLLKKIWVSIGPQFEAEYQNSPLSEDEAPFRKLMFWVQEDNDWVFYGACDPSLGKLNKTRDPSALLVGGFNRRTGVLDVVEAKIARRIPDRIISDVIELQRRYECQRWAIETVQFQAFFATVLRQRAAAAGVPVPVVEVIPHADKALRIESLQPYVASGLIRLHPSLTELTEQLRHWPMADHDDGPDALEMLWKIALGAGAITGVAVPPVPGKSSPGVRLLSRFGSLFRR